MSMSLGAVDQPKKYLKLTILDLVLERHNTGFCFKVGRVFERQQNEYGTFLFSSGSKLRAKDCRHQRQAWPCKDKT